MKIFIFYCALSVVTLSGYSQDKKGILFSDSSWNEVLAKAKSENKLIFMDAFTTWCGPCKMMAKNVFPDRQVAGLYNRNFINVAMDMEKGEGIILKDQYKVNAYPTYLFINGDGEIIHKFVGEHSIEQFIQGGLDALSPVRNLSYYEKNYQAKKNDYKFIAGYLDALKDAYEEAATNKVALDYLSHVKVSKLEDGGNWGLIENYLYDASSAPFQYVVDHQNQFEKLYGTEIVDKKIYSTYLMWPRNYLHYSSEGKLNFDHKGFDHFLSQIEKSRYIKKADVIGRSKLTIFSGVKDWKSYMNTLSGMVDKKIIPLNRTGAEDIYFYIDQVYRFGKENKNAIEVATNLAKIISEKISGLPAQNKANYQDMYANLLEVSGKNEEAKLVRVSIDRKKLEEAQKSNPFQQLQVAPAKK